MLATSDLRLVSPQRGEHSIKKQTYLEKLLNWGQNKLIEYQKKDISTKEQICDKASESPAVKHNALYNNILIKVLLHYWDNNITEWHEVYLV